jgi:SAM-dependent methyltransferase
MKINEKSKLDSYFKSRQVDASYYDDFLIPHYLMDVLPGNKNAKILDIGCGLGQYMVKLRELDYSSVLGIDISTEAINICKSKGLNAMQIRTIDEFKVLESEKFDFAILSHVLEHLPKDNVIDTLFHIREHLLSKNGFLVIMVPNAQSLSGTYWAYEDFTHNTMFTAGSLLYVLKAAGFKNIHFLDPSGFVGNNFFKTRIKSIFLYIFKSIENLKFKITSSTYHKPSPIIYTWELKVIVSNNNIEGLL